MAVRAAEMSMDPVTRYQIAIGNPPMLPAVEEAAMLARARAGDKAARQSFLRPYLPLVVRAARRYMGQGLPDMDVIQAGNEGLLRALTLYDSDKGPFPPFALRWARDMIRGLLQSRRRLRDVPIEAAADAMAASPQDDELAPAVNGVLGELSAPARRVIEYRYGLLPAGQRHTQREVAVMLGVSRERVKQIEAQALWQLRQSQAVKEFGRTWDVGGVGGGSGMSYDTMATQHDRAPAIDPGTAKKYKGELDANARLRAKVWADIGPRLEQGPARVRELAALILIEKRHIVAKDKTEIVKVPMSQGDTARWLGDFVRAGQLVADYDKTGTRYRLAGEAR